MKKLLKKSFVLDLVYSCCFILIFLATILLGQTNKGEFLVTIIGKSGYSDVWRQLFLILLIPGYIGLVYGAIGLCLSIKKLKTLDAMEAKVNGADEKTAKKFVKGYNMPLILLIIYFAATLGFILNGKGAIDVAVCVLSLVAACVLGFMAKSTRKQCLKSKGTELTAPAQTETQAEPAQENAEPEEENK